MAILDDIEITVVSEGEVSTEYDYPHPKDKNDAKTTERFIEALTGAKFAIRYAIKPTVRLYGAYCLRVRVFADGRRLQGKSVTRRMYTGDIKTMTHFCTEKGVWIDAKLVFGSIQTVEDESHQIDPHLAGELGCLTVTVQRVLRREHCTSSGNYPSSAVGAEVSEKAIKGKGATNCVTGIESAARGPPDWVNHRSLSGKHGQSYQFKFHYRSREYLQTLGCIPKSLPPPTPIEQGEPVAAEPADSYDEEIQRLRARLAELEARKKVGDGASSGGRAVKREGADHGVYDTPPRKRNRVIETIDLSED
ncbi:MAG: hypothetical protein M1839_003136 [Geoglossum umbratile]|nr:MAG: hypothetical protein M1839_003136 [Geoglossum umbratile]